MRTPEMVLSASPPPQDRPIPYTLLTARQKFFLMVLLGTAMLASPFTATIYMPIIPLLVAHFKTTTQAINLTITVYLIFQALSPAIFATLSDTLGRRSIFIITYTIYVLASLGLALNNDSYAALLVLRAVQSLGASAIISVAYGVVADVCVPSERGKMLGPIMVATNLGVCVGPVVGGWLASGPEGYQWVFRFLLIFGSLTLLAVGWWFPETARNVVGNGSLKATGLNRTWWSFVQPLITRRTTATEIPSNIDLEQCTLTHESRLDTAVPPRTKYQWKALNPFSCLRILFWGDTALTLWMTASFYAAFMCIQTSIPNIFQHIYAFSDLATGLSYLPGGFGIVLAGPFNGFLMDFNYRRTAAAINHTIDSIGGDDLTTFPIERARARSSLLLLAVYVTAQAGYGWSIYHSAHPAVPLVLQFVLGFVFTCFNQTYSTLLIDIFPASPSTASAAGAITRCGLSALAVGVMQPLIDTLGYGWYFTLLTAICGVGGWGAIWLIQSRGMRWRSKRLGRAEDEKDKEKKNEQENRVEKANEKKNEKGNENGSDSTVQE